jgi:hypothetical protein
MGVGVPLAVEQETDAHYHGAEARLQRGAVVAARGLRRTRRPLEAPLAGGRRGANLFVAASQGPHAYQHPEGC